MSEWIDVAPVADFKPGEALAVDVNDVMVAVFNINGEFFALENLCSHDGSPLIIEGLDPADQIAGDALGLPVHGRGIDHRAARAGEQRQHADRRRTVAARL